MLWEEEPRGAPLLSGKSKDYLLYDIVPTDTKKVSRFFASSFEKETLEGSKTLLDIVTESLSWQRYRHPLFGVSCSNTVKFKIITTCWCSINITVFASEFHNVHVFLSPEDCCCLIAEISRFILIIFFCSFFGEISELFHLMKND